MQNAVLEYHCLLVVALPYCHSLALVATLNWM